MSDNLFSVSQLDMLRQFCTPCGIGGQPIVSNSCKSAAYSTQRFRTACGIDPMLVGYKDADWLNQNTDYSRLGSDWGKMIGGTAGMLAPGLGGVIGLWGGHLLGTGVGTLMNYASGRGGGSENFWGNAPGALETGLMAIPVAGGALSRGWGAFNTARQAGTGFARSMGQGAMHGIKTVPKNLIGKPALPNLGTTGGKVTAGLMAASAIAQGHGIMQGMRNGVYGTGTNNPLAGLMTQGYYNDNVKPVGNLSGGSGYVVDANAGRPASPPTQQTPPAQPQAY